MAENKTKTTLASVEEHLAAIADEGRRRDCEVLAGIMARVSGEPAMMWGPSIVGFGTVHYHYESGREGEACLLGFASRKSGLVLYLGGRVLSQAALLARLGRHKVGKGCLYLRRLAEVDPGVLEALVVASIGARGAEGACG